MGADEWRVLFGPDANDRRCSARVRCWTVPGPVPWHWRSSSWRTRTSSSLQARIGTPAVLHTWNAPENGPMIAVNEALGFTTYQNLCEYQCAV